MASTAAAPYARFRVDSTGGLSPTGQAVDGEVEDYLVQEPQESNGGGGGGGCNTVGLKTDETLWTDILAIALMVGVLLAMRRRQARGEKGLLLRKR